MQVRTVATGLAAARPRPVLRTFSVRRDPLRVETKLSDAEESRTVMFGPGCALRTVSLTYWSPAR